MALDQAAAAPRGERTVREVVGVFDDPARMQRAVDALQEVGFNRADLSTAADVGTVRSALGGIYLDVREIEDNGEVPRRVFISKVSLGDAEGLLVGVCVYVPAMAAAALAASRGGEAGGIVAAAAIAGVLGGIIGWMLARALDRRYRRQFEAHLQHGGIVLWVAARDLERERTASRVLAEHGARHLHGHALSLEPRPMPGWRGVSYELSFMKRLRL